MASRVALLFNSIAGRGHAARRARQLAEGLALRGHQPIAVEFGPGAPRDAIATIDPPDAIVVVGGDGSVRMAAPIAERLNIPLWQCPCGTENLFAREFGMARSPTDIADALEARRIRRIDLGIIDGQPFTLMASVGYDASVVHRLARVRTGAISHMSYIRPMLSELASLSPPVLTVAVDGRRVINAQPGMLVIANCKQYAMRLNPASLASVHDGLLDLVFLPHRTRLGLAAWMLDTLRDRHLQRRRSLFLRAQSIEILAHDQALRFQVDGDALLTRDQPNAAIPTLGQPSAPPATDSAIITLRHAAMPVLLPATSASPALATPRGAQSPAAA